MTEKSVQKIMLPGTMPEKRFFRSIDRIENLLTVNVNRSLGSAFTLNDYFKGIQYCAKLSGKEITGSMVWKDTTSDKTIGVVKPYAVASRVTGKDQADITRDELFRVMQDIAGEDKIKEFKDIFNPKISPIYHPQTLPAFVTKFGRIHGKIQPRDFTTQIKQNIPLVQYLYKTFQENMASQNAVRMRR